MCCKLSLKSIFLGEKWKKKIFVLIQCLKSGKEAENTKKKLTSQAGIRTRFARTKLGLIDTGLDVLVFLANGGTWEMCSFNI